jgi:hypothetical protein
MADAGSNFGVPENFEMLAGNIPSGQGPEPQKAFVHVIFTGGTGRFEHATGTGTVEADLFPSKGFSQGKIVGNVIIPQPGQ